MIMQKENCHTFSITAVNEEGVLARMLGMFAARGYNVETITAAEVDHASNLSRITLVTSGTPAKIEQIKAQLDRIVAIQVVQDLTTDGNHIERELAIVKIQPSAAQREAAMQLANVYGAHVLDTSPEMIILEIVGTPDKVDAFMDDIKPYGFLDSARGGVVAIDRNATSVLAQSGKQQLQTTAKAV